MLKKKELKRTGSALLAQRTCAIRNTYKKYKDNPCFSTKEAYYKAGLLMYDTYGLQPSLDPASQIAFDCWRDTFANRFAFHKLREEKIITYEKSNIEVRRLYDNFQSHTSKLMKTYQEYLGLPEETRDYDKNKVIRRFISHGEGIDGKYKIGKGFAMHGDAFDVYCTYQNFLKYHGHLLSKQETEKRTESWGMYSPIFTYLRRCWDELEKDPTDTRKLRRFLHYGARVYDVKDSEHIHMLPDIEEILKEFEKIIITDPDVEVYGYTRERFTLSDEKLTALKAKHGQPAADTKKSEPERPVAKFSNAAKRRENLDKEHDKYTVPELNEFSDAAEFYDFYVTDESDPYHCTWSQFPEMQKEAVAVLRTAGDAVREYLEKSNNENVPPELARFYTTYLALPPMVEQKTEKEAN
jgi:hypothetical protein